MDCYASAIAPEKLNPVDSSHSGEHGGELVMQTRVHFELSKLNQLLQELIRETMPKVDRFYSNLLAANIIKFFAQQVQEQERLIAYARRNTEGHHQQATIILTSPFIRGMPETRRQNTECQSVTLVNQFALNTASIYPALSVCKVLLTSLLPSSRRARQLDTGSAVGATAAWGTDMSRQNDFFWWQYTDIPASRLKYMFERSDMQPTMDAVSEVSRLGISSVCMNRRARGEVHELYYWKRLPVSVAVRTAMVTLGVLLRAIFAEKWIRDVSVRLATEIVAAAKLERQYKGLDLDAVWHSPEAGEDRVTAAMHSVGGMRFGTHWSCYNTVDACSQRTHHVFFLWGPHDARICLDARSTSMYFLLAGCAIAELNSNAANRQLARDSAVNLRERGTNYILALFDSSTPSPNFYRFFLEWLIDDPGLGLLIKPKKAHWRGAYADLNDLFQMAYQTGRIHVFERKVWPADVAGAADFSIGRSQMSATVVSALAGARVINIDYERLDQHTLTKPYATLHQNGPERCVFYDHETLRSAVTDYVRDPSSNPHLGDATPMLDEFDPFRDGKARQRIGEYVQWYLKGRDNGLSNDDALRRATGIFADKWGADKVVRGL